MSQALTVHATLGLGSLHAVARVHGGKAFQFHNALAMCSD